MTLSQKCQYALRAVFELAKRTGEGPVRTAEIAEVQAIPKRFLEAILRQLRQAGFVESVRGNEGGYVLARSAEELPVGEVIRFIEGPVGPVDCVADQTSPKCPLHGDCVFLSLWSRVREAVEEIYDGTSFQDLVEEEKRKMGMSALEYTI